MKLPSALHSWKVSPREAVAIQRRLASSVIEIPPRREIRRVAGVDAAFTRDGRYCIAAVVSWDREEHRVVEQRVARRRVGFPYVPGLLSFREAPAVLAALRLLRGAPDALMCDGHGLAHPRRFGLACHVGVLTQIPTIGCAKSRLIGEHREPGTKRGARVRLVHDGRRVGTVLRTRDGVRPVYVSVGHRIDLPTAEQVVLGCGGGYRLPEPTRLADRLVAAVRLRS
jgi:deoxyribonuclease V